MAAGACFGTTWILRRLPDTAPLQRVAASPWLYAIRAGTSVVTVLTVTGLAHLLGPKWSGLMVGYPVNSLPVMVILHSHYGRDVIRSFIKIFPAGIFGVCLFNLVAWLVPGAPRSQPHHRARLRGGHRVSGDGRVGARAGPVAWPPPLLAT